MIYTYLTRVEFNYQTKSWSRAVGLQAGRDCLIVSAIPDDEAEEGNVNGYINNVKKTLRQVDTQARQLFKQQMDDLHQQIKGQIGEEISAVKTQVDKIGKRMDIFEKYLEELVMKKK